jgi:hypothetical protein
MSSTSDSQHRGTKPCLSADLIEGLFTSFAQRRFEKNAKTCILVPPPGSNQLEHSSSECCDHSGLKADLTECYGSISNHQNTSPPCDPSLPVDSIYHPKEGHRLCMLYNTDPDGVASHIADSKQIGTCQPSSTDHQRCQWCSPLD